MPRLRRRDAVYHHGWAQSRGDWREAAAVKLRSVRLCVPV